jgi:hypothetical protein
MKEDSSNRASISEGLHEGDLERGPLYWEPQNMSSKALEMGVCFHSGPEFGKHSGVLFLRFFSEKKSYRHLCLDVKRYVKRYVNRYLSL